MKTTLSLRGAHVMGAHDFRRGFFKSGATQHLLIEYEHRPIGDMITSIIDMATQREVPFHELGDACGNAILIAAERMRKR